jgi:hypothetical protein
MSTSRRVEITENSARAANTWKTSRPPEVVVSSCSSPAARRGWWCRAVRAGAEPDLAAAQIGHDGDQVLQGAAKSGQLGDHQDVTFEQLIKSLGQSGAGGVFSGELVTVDAFAADRGQGEPDKVWEATFKRG